MKVASSSSGMQGQCGSEILFPFCWSAGTREQFSITALLVQLHTARARRASDFLLLTLQHLS